MKNLLILTLFTSFWPIFVVRSESNIFGAILRVRSDAHLIAAINYTLDWLHLERPELGDFEVKIRYLDERNDHYDALGKACKLLDEIKISALFGSSDPQLTNQLKKLSYSLNIPFFTVADDFSYYKLDSIGGVKMPVQSEASITVFPQAYLIEALSDLIVHWKWTRVIIIYAEVDRLKRLIPFLESEIHGKIRFYFVRVENSNFLDAAQNVKNLEDCVYLNPRECFNDNRILVDMNPKDTFAFFVAV